MKKEISLVASKCITYVANGIGWLAFVVLSMVDNLVCSTLAAAILLICVVFSMKGRRATKEADDEMSEYNLIRAKATAMEWFRKIICIILLIFAIGGLLHELFPISIENINVSLGILVPITLGLTEITIGLLFVKYEKAGE